MADNKKQAVQFIYADRELLLQVADLLSAPVEVIVNAANSSLAHGGGIAGQIVARGGEIIQQQSDQFIKEHGTLESGMVAITSAGKLPFRAIIHAVGPVNGEGDEQRKIQQAVARSLQLCDMHDWKSIGFPAISTGIFSVPIEVSAAAFFHAITSYWDARIDHNPQKIMICLTQNNFEPFVHAFRAASMQKNEQGQPLQFKTGDESPPEVGVVELNEQDLVGQDNSDIDDWFK